jgi:hypothetical protein
MSLPYHKIDWDLVREFGDWLDTPQGALGIQGDSETDF